MIRLNLVWLRNDLRVVDNPALHAAAADGPVLACFLLTPGQWQRHHMAACRVDFLLRNLRCLSEKLGALHIPLLIEQLNSFAEVDDRLALLATSYGVRALYWNEEYPLDERQRDDRVTRRFRDLEIPVHRFHDRALAPPGSVVKADGEMYRVFTPFKRAWQRLLDFGSPDLLPEPARQAPVPVDSTPVPDCQQGFASTLVDGLWPAGEAEASRRLAAYVENRLESYQAQRDFPALRATSELSPYLAAGVLSPQQCLRAALDQRSQAREAVDCWINELAWRDFYQHLVVAFPDVCKGRPFKQETEAIAWRSDPEVFDRWCQGRTGIPIIDAGMRQLRATGWMHNRVRMIVAMFLSKNLLLDWRLGERFFMENLIDGDFAANNGGWQWSASTGTDAAPYFRIFNPFSQAARFDADGDYIRRYVPELGNVTPRDLHDPLKLGKVRPRGYPAPMVDVRQSRAAAIAAFREIG